MTEDQLFQLWDGWLDRIYKDVQNLVIGRHVYTEVQKIVQNNPRLHKPSSFYDLMTMTFSAWAAMAVRRQQEAYSISVVRLLQELEKRPEVLSRKRFVDTFANKMLAGSPGEEPAQPTSITSSGGAFQPSREFAEHIANETFDNYVGRGAPQIDTSQIRAELHELRTKAEKLDKFASKKIAHLLEQPTEVPTLDELDLCIDGFEAVVLRYVMLFRAAAPQDMLPTWQYNWKAIFREAWLSEG
jgi:hypothetical protein